MLRSIPPLALLLAASCSSSAPPPPPSAPPRHFGEIMSEVGWRFERVGRAAQAQQWELVDYDLGELGEVFEGEVPTAEVPTDVPVDVRPLASAFAATQLPALRSAAAAHDAAAFATAFATAAATCNGCHEAAAHGFIVVPSRPGDAVPVIATPPAAPSAPSEEPAP